MKRPSGRELVVVSTVKPVRVSPTIAASIVVPAIIADAGHAAGRRFLEFFAATIRNKNTRMAYYRACCRFFAWCDEHRIGQLADIEPLHVAAYIETMQIGFERPSVKQHLAAIRMLFDWLVTGQIVAANGFRTFHVTEIALYHALGRLSEPDVAHRFF